MGVILKQGSKIPKSLHELNQTNNIQQYRSEAADDDFELDGEPSTDFIEYSPPKRLRGKGITFTEDDTDFDDIPATRSTTVIDKQPSKPIVTKKIRMTAEIRQDLHLRLRIYAARTGRTNIQIIENWIESHCPE